MQPGRWKHGPLHGNRPPSLPCSVPRENASDHVAADGGEHEDEEDDEDQAAAAQEHAHGALLPEYLLEEGARVEQVPVDAALRTRSPWYVA